MTHRGWRIAGEAPLAIFIGLGLVVALASAQTSGVSCSEPGHTLVIECRAATACDTGELIAASKDLIAKTQHVMSSRTAVWSAVGVTNHPCARDPQSSRCLHLRASEAAAREQEISVKQTAEARWRKAVEACSR